MSIITNFRILRFILAVAFIALPLHLQGQVFQRVLVVEYIPDLEGKDITANKIPLANVEVSVKGAGSTVTDAEGMCMLKFNLAKQGDHLQVRSFIRPGYEVLNPDQLQEMVIRRDNKPLEVVMISQENAVKLGRFISQQVGTQYEKMRLRELNELDKMAADYEKKRQEIITKYERRLDDVDMYIDRMIRVDITRVSETERSAIEAFHAGDIDAALAVLEGENLIDRYREVVRDLGALQTAHAKVDEEKDLQLQQRTDLQYFLKTQITMLEMEGSEKSLRKALDLLKQMLEMDPMGVFQGMEYMRVAIALKDLDFAIIFANEQLKNTNLSNLHRFRFLVCIGSIYDEQKRYMEAHKIFHDAKELIDDVMEEHSDDPLSNFLAMFCHQSLGHCDMLEGSHEESVDHYRRMFNYYLRLRDIDAKGKIYARATYPRLIRSIHTLQMAEEWALSDSIYNSAFPRVQELYSTGPLYDQYLWLRFRMGKFRKLLRQNQRDEAMRTLFSLLPELENIYQQNPPLCEEFYTNLLFLSAGYYYDNQRYADATRTAKKWFEVSRLPYNKDKEPNVPYVLDDETLRYYKDICFMYEKSLGYMPKNP